MTYREDNETIVALATAQGKAALAIIRISGKDALKSIENCITPSQKFIKAPLKSIKLYQIIDNETKKIIDEVTVIKYKGPESYTGENLIEMICHGNELIIEEILSVIFKMGIRLAKQGEFTRRALINGKIDLLKAESINQIINSTNKWNYKNALEMYSGRSKQTLTEWKKEIISILAEIDARIEFPEEEDITKKNIEHKKKLKDLLAKIEKELKLREKINFINSGIIIPIVGIANAGKSSLFNVILGFNRTIVHHEEGTTRDAVSEEIVIKGEKIKIVDTAGLNETKNKIELIGIEKSWEYIKNGNLIILVTPADREIKENEKRLIKDIKKEKTIVIISKKDINKTEKKKAFFNDEHIPFIEACLINDNERNAILDFIGSNIEKKITFQENEYGVICNKRHEEIFIRINKKVKSIVEKIDSSYDEMISYELKEILQDLEEFVGETCNEEILDSIFSEFCIGK
jgi:tRNA modification GTPase